MKKLYTLFFCTLSALAVAQSEPWQWVEGIEAAFGDPLQRVSVDAQGNVYSFASFMSDIITDEYELHNANPQQPDAYFIKKNANGETQFVRQLGGLGHDTVWALDTDDAGNIFVTGTYSNGITFNNQNFSGAGTYIAKYNTNGDLQWVKTGTHSFMRSLVVSATGEIHIAGTFNQSFTYDGTTLTTVSNSSTPFVAKLDAQGELIWAQVAESENDATAPNAVSDIAVDSEGNVFATGFYYSNQITFGQITLDSQYMFNVYLVKYDVDGNALWVHAAGNNNCANNSNAVAVDQQGNVYFAGQFCNVLDFGATTVTAGSTGSKFFIMKYDNNGEWLGAGTSTGGLVSIIYSLDVDVNGNLIAGGTYVGPLQLGNQMELTNTNEAQFIVKYNQLMEPIWLTGTGEVGINNPVSVAAYGDNTIYVAGHVISSSITLGDYTFTKTGNNIYNIYLAKLNATPLAALAFEKQAVLVYPNPATDVVNVQTTDTVKQLTITDCNGRIVGQASGVSSITTSGLAKGIYFLTVTTGTGQSTQKIVKE